MSGKLHKTKGIVLRTVKYGETSLVVTIFTELFGIQSYLLNGVRTHSKKGAGKAGLFQPATILDLVVYHNELKHLNRIREFKLAVFYTKILTDIPAHAVALFFVELLTRCLKQPEQNSELFRFTENLLRQLDQSSATVMANLPLFAALHLPVHFGFRIDDNYSEKRKWLDLKEGLFTEEQPHHPYFLEGKEAFITAQLLKVTEPGELQSIPLGHDFRRQLLLRYETFYALHIPDFGSMKTLPVLRELLN